LIQEERKAAVFDQRDRLYWGRIVTGPRSGVVVIGGIVIVVDSTVVIVIASTVVITRGHPSLRTALKCKAEKGEQT